MGPETKNPDYIYFPCIIYYAIKFYNSKTYKSKREGEGRGGGGGDDCKKLYGHPPATSCPWMSNTVISEIWFA